MRCYYQLFLAVAASLLAFAAQAQTHTERSVASAQSDSAVPPDAPPPANRLSGVYLGMHFEHGPAASAVGAVQALAFFPDGTAMYLPDVGLDGYDLRRAVGGGLDPLNYGTYTYRNDKVRFTSRNGVARDLDIDPTGGVPNLSYVRACHCNGARFAGTYYYGIKTQTITFLPDGRFVDRGAIHDAFQYAYVNNPPMTAPGAGTYKVMNYTIYLSYSDGRQFKYSFTVAPHPPKTPSAMWIRGISFDPVPGGESDESPAEPDASRILASGKHPLTQKMTDDFSDFFTWVFALKLTSQQNQMIQDYLVTSWAKDPPKEITAKLQIVNLYRDLMLMSSDRREQARQKLLPVIAQSLQSEGNAVSSMLLKAYQSHR